MQTPTFRAFDFAPSMPRFRSHARHVGHSTRALISFLAFRCALGAGAAEYFVAADGRDARITGRDTVKVWADGAANPTAVRYNWGMQGFGNLYNAAGIPASCFTTEP